MTTPAVPVPPALEQRLGATPLLLLLDVDGTLSPIAPRPDYAKIPENTQEILRDLARASGVHVAFISGRSVSDVRAMIGVEHAWVIGNHGIEVAAADAPPTIRTTVAPYEAAIREAVRRCEAITGDKPGVIVENKRWTVSVHYRLAHPGIVPALEADVSAVASQLGLRLTHGKEVLELRPPVDIDKGVAAVDLARRLHAVEGGSVLCAGDDRTDEDMFRSLRELYPRSVTVRVGVEPGRPAPDTDAEFCVQDTTEMRALLEWVLARRRRAVA